MNIVEAYKKAFNIIFHPSKLKKTKNIKETFIFFYSIATIPILLTILFGFIFEPTLLFLVFYIVFAITFFLIIPFFIFISSGLYYILIKKLFNLYKNNFKDTFTAFIYSYLPYVLFFWLLLIPILGFLFYIILVVWSFILSILIFSKIFNISKWKAFGTIFLNWIIWGFVLVAILFLLYL